MGERDDQMHVLALIVERLLNPERPLNHKRPCPPQTVKKFARIYTTNMGKRQSGAIQMRLC